MYKRQNYCITLDRIPDHFLDDIANNSDQRLEWVQLFGIDTIEKDLNQPGYTEPLSAEFIKAFSSLCIDTRHFTQDFTNKLLASLDDLDSSQTGLLICSENFQAVNLLRAKHRGSVTSFYLDPPYNTDAGPISYKNGFRSSSWLSLFENRLRFAKEMLSPEGIICVTIDDFEAHNLRFLLDSMFNEDNLLGVCLLYTSPSPRD